MTVCQVKSSQLVNLNLFLAVCRVKSSRLVRLNLSASLAFVFRMYICFVSVWHVYLCLSVSQGRSKSLSTVSLTRLACTFDLASMSNLDVKLTTFMSSAFTLFNFYFAIPEWLVRFFVRAREFGMTQMCVGRGEGYGGSRARQGQNSPDKCEYMQ